MRMQNPPTSALVRGTHAVVHNYLSLLPQVNGGLTTVCIAGSAKQQQKAATVLEVSEPSNSDGQESSDDEASRQPSNYDITASSEGEDSNMQGKELCCSLHMLSLVENMQMFLFNYAVGVDAGVEHKATSNRLTKRVISQWFSEDDDDCE